MISPPKIIPFERYLTIDAHKRYVVVDGLNAQQVIVILSGQAWLTSGEVHRSHPGRCLACGGSSRLVADSNAGFQGHSRQSPVRS
jgi:hypothetical protein